ncbi:lipase (class 3) [Lucifera butyrica]|uniref:Lipase (Class 3) n=2 Tax=Lucifera butyrica TaxID=1351585 RepID=A0A498RII2_9FIRM|nr:lipase (class 3) [Lucifera butyrica]
MITRAEYAALCVDIYHDENYMNPRDFGFTLIHSKEFPSGLYVETYQKISTGELVVVARGTEITNWKDDAADFNLGCNKVPGQYVDFKNYVNYIRDTNPNAVVSITGHSLAGAYVQLYDADMALYPDPKHGQITGETFGAPAMSAVVWNNWGLGLENKGFNLDNYRNFNSYLSVENVVRTGDPVPAAFWPCFELGRTVIVPQEGYTGLTAHSSIRYYYTSRSY